MPSFGRSSPSSSPQKKSQRPTEADLTIGMNKAGDVRPTTSRNAAKKGAAGESRATGPRANRGSRGGCNEHRCGTCRVLSGEADGNGSERSRSPGRIPDGGRRGRRLALDRRRARPTTKVIAADEASTSGSRAGRADRDDRRRRSRPTRPAEKGANEVDRKGG